MLNTHDLLPSLDLEGIIDLWTSIKAGAGQWSLSLGIAVALRLVGC